MNPLSLPPPPSAFFSDQPPPRTATPPAMRPRVPYYSSPHHPETLFFSTYLHTQPAHILYCPIHRATVCFSTPCFLFFFRFTFFKLPPAPLLRGPFSTVSLFTRDWDDKALLPRRSRFLSCGKLVPRFIVACQALLRLPLCKYTYRSVDGEGSFAVITVLSWHSRG